MKIGLKTKLLAGFVSIAVVTVISGFIGIQGLKDSLRSIKGIGCERLPSVDNLWCVMENLDRVVLCERGLIIRRFFAVPQIRKAQYEVIEKAHSRITVAWSAYNAIPKAPEEAAVWSETQSFYDKWKTSHDAFIKLSEAKGAAFDAEGKTETEKQNAVQELDAKMIDAAVESRNRYLAVYERLEKLVEINKANAATTLAQSIASSRKAETIMIAASATAFVLSLILGFAVSISITNPVRKAKALAEGIANGDFSQRLRLKHSDEIGDLTRALDASCESLSHTLQKIQEDSRVLAASSEELTAVSDQLVKGSEETTAQANAVASATEQTSSNVGTMAAAAEQMSANVATVSAAAEQMSRNMTTVASSVEEMTTSITEVATNARNGADIAQQAVRMGAAATDTMSRLGTAAREIGKVTMVIKRIAEQTNLLALNATIEAASAGEAGKGFAVVANEIKELANQSAHAAEDIATKIEGVQANTAEAVKAISDVSSIIGGVTSSVTTISEAVAQQSKAANEIASNIAETNKGISNVAASIMEVSKGATDVSQNAGEAAKATNEVARNIGGVSQSAKDSSAGAAQLNSSAGDLARIAGELQLIVSKFKITASA